MCMSQSHTFRAMGKNEGGIRKSLHGTDTIVEERGMIYLKPDEYG